MLYNVCYIIVFIFIIYIYVLYIYMLNILMPVAKDAWAQSAL